MGAWDNIRPTDRSGAHGRLHFIQLFLLFTNKFSGFFKMTALVRERSHRVPGTIRARYLQRLSFWFDLTLAGSGLCWSVRRPGTV